MSSKTPCVSCRYSGALPNIPQKSPISEWTIWPPISGSESTSTTRRPSRADSIAAVEPAIPAPTTHTSARTACSESPDGLVIASSFSSVSACGITRTVDSRPPGNKQKIVLHRINPVYAGFMRPLSQTAGGFHDQPPQPGVRRVLLVLAVPPQRLDDRLVVAGAFEHLQVRLGGEPGGEPLLHQRHPVGARDEVRHGEVALDPDRDPRLDVEQRQLPHHRHRRRLPLVAPVVR